MRKSQNSGRVARIKTEMLEKKLKWRGVAAGGVTLFITGYILDPFPPKKKPATNIGIELGLFILGAYLGSFVVRVPGKLTL